MKTYTLNKLYLRRMKAILILGAMFLSAASAKVYAQEQVVERRAVEQKRVDRKVDRKIEKISTKKSRIKKEEKKYSEEEIMAEISYLADKLLALKGTESMSISSSPYTKPFVGVCSQVIPEGIELTCITPKSQADKDGLKTGDILTEINDTAMVEGPGKHPYWPIINGMKVGDVLNIALLRAGEMQRIKVTVGELKKPGYECDITR
ncbi:MAG: PDZ domain-containing protein [Acidiferrobacterales bacterium]|nr:PDZ domain-containing protein [Acidiferrobacterales bacterium]